MGDTPDEFGEIEAEYGQLTIDTFQRLIDKVTAASGIHIKSHTFRKTLTTDLLERGKAYPPNSFPRAPYDLSRNFWDPSEGLYGMYNIWSFKGSGAVVCSGLGGGSLCLIAGTPRGADGFSSLTGPEPLA